MNFEFFKKYYTGVAASAPHIQLAIVAAKGQNILRNFFHRAGIKIPAVGKMRVRAARQMYCSCLNGRTDIFPLRSLCVGVAPTSLARLSISENETIRATTRCFYRSILYNSSSVCWRVQSSVHFDLTVEARKERRLAGCHFDPTFARRRTIEIGKKGMKRKWKHKYIIKIELNAQRSFLLFLLAHFQLWSSSSEIVVLQDCALAIMANIALYWRTSYNCMLCSGL